MKRISAAILFCVILPGCGFAKEGAIDLSGDWQLKLLECVQHELNCQKNLGQRSSFVVHQPQNLREIVPWFTGKAVLTKKFKNTLERSPEDLRLLIASIGSVDETDLNGKAIGQTGYATLEKNLFISSWMRVRYYRIPEKVLNPLENTIQITFYSLDPKSGIYLGPILIGENSDLRMPYLFQKFVREQFFYFVSASVVFVFFFVIATFVLQKLNYHFLVFSLAVAAFFCHSLYFIEMPVELPYDVLLKFQTAGRIISMYTGGSWVHYTLTGRTSTFLKVFLPLATLILLAILFAGKTTEDVFNALRIAHASIVIYLLAFLPWLAIVYQKLKPRVNAGYFPALLLVQIFYSIDFSNYMYWTNLPWLNHYFSGVYHLGFVIVQSHMLFEWEKTAFQYKLNLNIDRLRIARDIHDAIGSDLTQIIVQARTIAENRDQSRLELLAKSAFEKIKDMVFLLKNDQEHVSIRNFILDHTQFLRANQRYDVHLNISDVFISAVDNVNLQRIFSEWLSNVIRHSKPGKVAITFKEKKGQFVLLVSDDGFGFSWDGLPNSTGLGNLANRTARLGGKICARQRSGHGLNLFLLKFPRRKTI